MNGLDGIDVIDAINESVRKLQQGIDSHCCLLNAIVKRKVGPECLEQVIRQCPQRSREALLTDALKEAIEVLDESRKAFKSKRLEVLRKRLTAVLIQSN